MAEIEVKNKKRFSFVKGLITFVLVITVFSLCLIAFYLLRPKVSDWIEGLKEGKVTENLKTVVTSEENVVIDVVKKTQPSVVSIAVSQMDFQPGQGIVDTSSNIGTGFIVDNSGIIVTNQHVVSDSTEEYKVITSEGKEFKVDEILVDNVNDIAILKIKGNKLSAIKLGNSDNLQVGQLVIAIGTPLGDYAGSVTTGVISGLNRSVSTKADFFGTTTKEYYDVIQTDAAINPGNSGGPLINSSGEVIGVNFATTAGADNISFALPINVVKSRLEEYRKYGKFIRPYIGVEYQMISEEAALYYRNVVAGALVVRVVSDSPASKAGLKKGDIITEINGEKMSKSLATVVQGYKVGEELTLKLWRDGKTVEVKLKLEEAS
ncbi:MAG: Peptidase S1 and S6 chymotrypsin/Hap [candidate division WS6 bacterium GW2011_GWF2_39_15]|uniref:Peptidase S1 and S6 chymotrypsin/Hap n=1 Tax=candidate division WS6 bacterium GW2011_GWF2_39_15 TaxID=1619100 RepID=A0A0G0MT29_9BACT|nr:MAG: Peptidase S1 and S6 chymotrypsin/Hap [candidate division WS6 bacterium GW2011_GWF2_39_15]